MGGRRTRAALSAQRQDCTPAFAYSRGLGRSQPPPTPHGYPTQPSGNARIQAIGRQDGSRARTGQIWQLFATKEAAEKAAERLNSRGYDVIVTTAELAK